MTFVMRLIRQPAHLTQNSAIKFLQQQYAAPAVTPIRLRSGTTEKHSNDQKSQLPPVVPPHICPPEPQYPPSKIGELKDAPSWSKWPPPTQDVKKTTSQRLSRENVENYMFKHFFDYIKNYEKLFEKNFPSAMKVYRTYVDGVMDFYNDMKAYLKISRIANSSPMGLKALNRKELELYMQMPRDMMKVAPALFGAALPLVGYVVMPLIFAFPQQCLCSHFWTLQQRAEFQQVALQKRLKNNKLVLRILQSKLKDVKKHQHHDQLQHILGMLGSGFHPSVEALLEVKDIFAQPPYDLLSLTRKQIGLLCQLHGVPTLLFKRFHLSEHAFLVHHMDLAIVREGHVHNMHPDGIRRSCYIRGLNPVNLSTDEMISWLRNWIKISTSIEEHHISMFLYLPILLGYNHPNNWHLIYDSS
ncbi:PREDICTED: LETM1 domain-containing protein 1 [Rhagoletis zephyria]|uniref:LETM1 domain-containing protein 1 n=1 Tax=Rhagoletis zephyria TaxID=28612 RepID=UPI0008114972|nr:PREDICTED: LETM1 domain-containing protein 1 [Rhagoletis zephyria]